MQYPIDYINKVVCADCLIAMKDIPDKSVDLVCIDPPYGMDFQSNYRKEKYNKITNDSSLNWIDDCVSELHRVLKENTHAYIFCSFHNVDIFKQSLEKVFKVKNILIWEKNNTSMGDLFGDYAPKYEMIIYVHKGRKLLNGGRDANILKFSRTGNKLHPTEKPLDLISYLIGKSSNENDTVMDCFAGSFTTAIACKNLKRNWICIEKEEEYCKIGIERINKTDAII